MFCVYGAIIFDMRGFLSVFPRKRKTRKGARREKGEGKGKWGENAGGIFSFFKKNKNKVIFFG